MGKYHRIGAEHDERPEDRPHPAKDRAAKTDRQFTPHHGPDQLAMVPGVGERRQQIHLRCGLEWLREHACGQWRPMAPDVDQFEPLPSTLARRSIHRGGARVQMLPRINSPFSVYSWHLSHSCGDGNFELEGLEKGS